MKIEATILLAGVAVAAAQQHFYSVPFVEENYDFTGKDITNVQAKSIDGCIEPCSKNDKCHAYSWSSYNGGTCWLKESKGQAVFKVGVKSSGIYPSPPQVCQLKEGVDYIDNDLDHVSGVTKAEDCCDKCKKLDRCRVYTWSNYQNGTCWFKTQRGTAIFKDGVKAGSVFPDDEFTPAYYVDVDFVGHDIGAVPGKFEACDGACKKLEGCRVYTWTDYQGGMCWLKAKKDKTATKSGAKSGVIDKKMAVAKKVVVDVSFHDNDFKNVAGIPEAEDCIQICADYAGCKAVTWSDYRKGTCWLKHGEGIPDAAKGQKSFILA